MAELSITLLPSDVVLAHGSDESEISVSIAADQDLSVTLLPGAVIVADADVAPAEISFAPITIEGPVGQTGAIGPVGPPGPKGESGLFGEPEIPNLTLLFENQLI